jgi:hypothetical protein
MYNGIFVPETIKEKATEENKMFSLGIKIREHATKRKKVIKNGGFTVCKKTLFSGQYN